MELTVEVPLRVQSVVDRPGREDLSAHGHFTVGVTFTWRMDMKAGERRAGGCEENRQEEAEEVREKDSLS